VFLQFKTARRSVLRHWRQSIASLLAITLGFIAICLFEGFIVDLRAEFEQGYHLRGMFGHVLIERPGAAKNRSELEDNTLGEKERAFIDSFLKAEEQQVLLSVRRLYLSGLVSNGRASLPFAGYGYDVDAGKRLRGPVWAWNTVAGKPLDLSPNGNSVVVAKGLAGLLDCELPEAPKLYGPDGGYLPEVRPFKCFRNLIQLQSMTKTSQLNALNVNMTGVMDHGLRVRNNSYVLMPLELAQTLMNTRDVSCYMVELKDGALVEGFVARFTRAAQAQHVDLEATRWQSSAFGETYRGTMSLLTGFQLTATIVMILIGAMAIINTLTKSVAERTREIGTLRSIGFGPGFITQMFALEGSVLALLACGLGAVITFGASWVINHLGLSFTGGITTFPVPLRIHIVPAYYLLTAVLLTFVATLSAYIPARSAGRMKIVEALGHV